VTSQHDEEALKSLIFDYERRLQEAESSKLNKENLLEMVEQLQEQKRMLNEKLFRVNNKKISKK
jgi:hypothetical protein